MSGPSLVSVCGEEILDDISIAMPVIAYCETGAFSDPIKELCRANLIKVIHFPYDADDRAWHENNKNKVSFAIPSLVTCDTTQVYCSDDFLISDMEKSDKYDAIGLILQMDHRKHDVRHFDSAYKSGARVFLTNDKNFRNHRAELLDLTGVEVILVREVKDIERLKQIIANSQPN